METLIDINTLFSLLASRTGEALLLGTCQIDELKLADGDVHRVSQILRLNRQAENTVRTRTKVVEIMAGENSIPCTILVQIEDFLRRGRFKNVQVFDDELVFFGPSDAEARLPLDRVASLAAYALHNLRVQQVENLLVVDLQEADEDAVVSG